MSVSSLPKEGLCLHWPSFITSPGHRSAQRLRIVFVIVLIRVLIKALGAADEAAQSPGDVIVRRWGRERGRPPIGARRKGRLRERTPWPRPPLQGG